MQYQNSSLSVSNILLLTSLITTIIALYYVTELYDFGIHGGFLAQGDYLHYIMSLFIGVFLHGSLFHLISNSIFIYIFGNIVESNIGENKYIGLFLFTTLLNGITISVLNPYSVTVGISGFALAVLTYFTLELRLRNHPDWKGGLMAIIINLIIGFVPGISLIGHLFGAIYGAIYYIITKKLMK